MTDVEDIFDIFGDVFGDVFGDILKSTRQTQWEAISDDELYAACRIKGKRATQLEMEARFEALKRIVREVRPCSVRQVYYQATVHGVVEKTDPGYDKVQRGLVDLRRAGEIPYRYITDNTRWQIKPTTYNSIQNALEETARLYRRAVWSDVDAYCEV